MRYTIALFTLFISQILLAQDNVELVRNPNIRGIKLFKKADQLAYPIIPLNSQNELELHFDDVNNTPKNYFYTYQLCNADWSPANLSQFDYIKGFSQVRISTFRPSSIAFTRYTHYTTTLPAANCMPSRSGNYLLKVFADGDTTKLLFTKRLLVVNTQVSVATQVLQPFDQKKFRTHQKIVTTINMQPLDIFNPQQQLKVVVLQNNRWDNAQWADNPTFMRGKTYEYNDENKFVFEGGKEWRWLDLRSFRLQSDRVRRVDYNANSFDIWVTLDTARSPKRYLYYGDINGMYYVDVLESINPWWQSDYARVHFTFMPHEREAFVKQDIYVFGEMTGYNLNDSAKMIFNADKGVYERVMNLKMGYYNYAYVTVPTNHPEAKPSFDQTEGNNWETENKYTTLVYYRSFGGRADELVGVGTANTLANVPRN